MDNGDTMSGLFQEKGRNDILDTIDELRSWGMGHYIDLPQIIVCGDQSSGKSSVLEALSGIQFPRKDNLCTRFATEVILRRNPKESTAISIMPATDRSEVDKAKLHAFQSHGTLDSGFSSVVDDAMATMGIASNGEGRNFSNDILRLEVSGPKQPHLTLVDLPGLFRAGTRSQSDEDAEAITSLVLSYMEKSRSIILAVVSAKNNLANQIVTKYAREKDPNGSRTLGIITKPDTLFAGSDSERDFFELAENRDIKFRHGWHVLRNRDYDARNASLAERDSTERDFFSNGVWATLPKSQTGIAYLKPRLSILLRQQIVTELPSLIEDVEWGILECKTVLKRLGEARGTLQEQRLYLLRVSQKFTTLMKSAIDGVYNDAFFGDAFTEEGYAKRLRSVIQNTLLDFSKVMREEGHASHIVEGTVEPTTQAKNPRLISKDNFVDDALMLMRRTRGRELPGTYNPGIISDLFHAQAKPWSACIERYILKVWEAALRALSLVINEAVDMSTAANLKQTFIGPAMAKLKHELEEAAQSILEPHRTGHPITYNHYFTENVQKLRIENQKKNLAARLDSFLGTDMEGSNKLYQGRGFDVRKLLTSLTEDTIADMDRYACSEAIDCMRAYYKVALKRVVDDISVLAIEKCLIWRLPSIFCPEVVVRMEDNVISSIASETEESSQERGQTVCKQAILEKASHILNSLRDEDIVNHEKVDDEISSRGTSPVESIEPESHQSEQDPQNGSLKPPPVDEWAVLTRAFTPSLAPEIPEVPLDPKPENFGALDVGDLGTSSKKKSKRTKGIRPIEFTYS